MKKTLLSIFLAFTAATALPAQEQKFTVSGNIEGLEAGDTLRFEQIIMPGWKTGDCFDIVLKKDGKFCIRKFPGMRQDRKKHNNLGQKPYKALGHQRRHILLLY